MDQLIGIEEALRIVLETARPLPDEAVELSAALGRTLAVAVTAAGPVPPFTGSAMDGYAVRAQDVAGAALNSPVLLSLVGESRAGRPSPVSVRSGEAIAISTGAALPAGADAVIPVEQTQRAGADVEVLRAVAEETFVRPAGGDLAAGQSVLARGTRLGAAELGVLASVGCARPRCTRLPRVRILTTGDELVSAGEPMHSGSVRDCSGQTLPALARAAGGEIAGVARESDDYAALTAAVTRALDADVTVICGGVSVGTHDHVKAILEAGGVRKHFAGVALKPGKPTWFGTHEGSLVFGLPGNPVSSMVTFMLLVAPALRALSGAPRTDERVTATIAEDYDKQPGRAHAVRCRLQLREDGWWAYPTGAQDSHLLTSMLGADALAIISRSSGRVRAGERVEVMPIGRLMGARG